LVVTLAKNVPPSSIAILERVFELLYMTKLPLFAAPANLMIGVSKFACELFAVPISLQYIVVPSVKLVVFTENSITLE